MRIIRFFARISSFLFVAFKLTMKWLYTSPILIMATVVNMFSTIFWAVPLFNRVLPVIISGPTSTNMGWSAYWNVLEPGLQLIAPTWLPRLFAYRIASTTKAAPPLAVMPTRESLELNPISFKA